MTSRALDRLGNILAVADNGATEGERDDALRKAEQMAAVIGVELSVARAHHADKAKRETPEKRTFKVGDERSRYNAYLVELFGAIAGPHDVIVTVGSRNIFVFGYGLPSDLDIVHTLYGVAAVKMVTDANAALRRGEQRTAGRYGRSVDGRVYRAHFYQGFRSQLQTRLWEARRHAISADTSSATGQPGAALVLRDKAREVEEYYEDDAKHWSRRSTWKAPQRQDYVADAVRSGADSAARTDLVLTGQVGSARRSQLTASPTNTTGEA